MEIFKQIKKTCTMTFDEIKDVLLFEIEHSFLKYKENANKYDLEVSKISITDKTILFRELIEK